MEVRLVNQQGSPGTVRLLHQICTEAEARRADLNRAADRARVEVAVHILTSGACAAELASGNAWNPNDSSLQFAADLVSLAAGSAAEADAHFAWLKLRASGRLSTPHVWTAVAAVAEALIKERHLTESRVRHLMVTATRSAAGLTPPHATRPAISNQEQRNRTPTQVGDDARASRDQVVDAGLVANTRRELLARGLDPSLRMLADLEPELHRLIELEASGALFRFKNSLAGQQEEEVVRSAVYWAGVLVSEVLRRAHYRLWCGTALGSLLEEIDPSLRAFDLGPEEQEHE